jgi:2-methylcitrate dehydratase
VEQVEVEIFDVAFHIIGGGEEGEKRTVRNKEQADHSLPYLIAVALLDGDVMPGQFVAERIHRADVRELLRKVWVRPSDELSRRFPQELPCRVNVRLKDGRNVSAEKSDYEGFTSNPVGWETAVRKFQALSEPHTTSSVRKQLVDVTTRDPASYRSSWTGHDGFAQSGGRSTPL